MSTSTTTSSTTTTAAAVIAIASDTGTIVGGVVGGLAIIALVAVVYILKSKKVVVIERERVLPPIPNPTFDDVDYEEPCPIQPILDDQAIHNKGRDRRRQSVTSESLYNVETDGYLNVTGEEQGATSI